MKQKCDHCGEVKEIVYVGRGWFCSACDKKRERLLKATREYKEALKDYK